MAGQGKGAASTAPVNELDHDTKVTTADVNENQLTYDTDSSDGETDPDPQDIANYNYREGKQVFQFKDLGEAIDEHQKPLVAGSLDGEVSARAESRTAHNQKHRASWRALRKQVDANSVIPNSLWNPPRSFIRVSFAEWPQHGHYCCPCDLPDNLPNIEIRASKGQKDGITKDLFLQKVGEALYGLDEDDAFALESSASVNNDEHTVGSGCVIGGENHRPVLDHVTYMLNACFESEQEGQIIMGDIYVMVRYFA